MCGSRISLFDGFKHVQPYVKFGEKLIERERETERERERGGGGGVESNAGFN